MARIRDNNVHTYSMQISVRRAAAPSLIKVGNCMSKIYNWLRLIKISAHRAVAGCIIVLKWTACRKAFYMG